MTKNWRAGWLGWLLNIHSPVGHAEETCWCIGTKRELVVPNFMTNSQALSEIKDFAEYFSYFDAMIASSDAYENYLELIGDHEELIVSRGEFLHYINTAHERQEEQDNG